VHDKNSQDTQTASTISEIKEVVISDALVPVTINIPVLWDVTTYRLVDVYHTEHLRILLDTSASVIYPEKGCRDPRNVRIFLTD
jgi:hypothetical protein